MWQANPCSQTRSPSHTCTSLCNLVRDAAGSILEDIPIDPPKAGGISPRHLIQICPTGPKQAHLETTPVLRPAGPLCIRLWTTYGAARTHSHACAHAHTQTPSVHASKAGGCQNHRPRGSACIWHVNTNLPIL
uniref:Uncharacterized protein n=1 Tax=Sphaerodactylus townsendi TaxID=933632 RepID=A0ACB8F7Z0_9SAUR